MDLTLLQVFLVINVFIMGILVAVAVRHAYAHFRQPLVQEEDKITSRPKAQAQVVTLPIKIKERLIESSQIHFQSVLNRSATTLERDLKTTTNKLTNQLDKVGSDIILTEMKRYRGDLEALRKQAETIIEGAQRDVVEHQGELKAEMAKKQAELETKLKEEIDAEKQELSEQINQKLSDAVASFLTETMQHEIDLGAQTVYLTKLLDEHKAELIKELMDEA